MTSKMTDSADTTFLAKLFPVRLLLLLSGTATLGLVSSYENYDILDGDVINLPIGKFPEPECKYHVRYRDRNGSELKRQVEIGEPVYHHWTCSYGQQHTSLYCILVNNCTVSNSRPL
ncbi:unnamed protein product, partial [Gongylonema pulchrum]